MDDLIKRQTNLINQLTDLAEWAIKQKAPDHVRAACICQSDAIDKLATLKALDQ